jgi:polar amino acid transport system substrate-binding protein
MRAILFLLCSAVSISAGAETITLTADPWLPYNGVATREPAGYMVDAARLIAHASGDEIDYGNLPWDESLDAVRSGRIDCVVGAAKADAEDFAFPDVSWGLSQIEFYGLNDTSWRFSGIASLEQVRLAVIEDYSVSDSLDAYVAANRTNPNRIAIINGVRRATMSAVSSLVSKKADVFAEDNYVMQLTLSTMQMSDRVIKLGAIDEPSEVYIACTPVGARGAVLARKFSDGLVKLRASGELQKILDNYQLHDWAK